MRYAAFILLLISALPADAQTCVFTENPVPENNWFYLNTGVVRSDGSVITMADPEVGIGGYLTRWAPDGSVMWNKQVKHMNPTMWMQGLTLENASNGNLLIGGNLYPGFQYQNTYLVETDENAVMQWGRIYMLDSTLTFANGFASFKEYPPGGYVCTHGSASAVSVSRLNTSGIPIWTWRYQSAMGISFIHMATYPLGNGNIMLVACRGIADVFVILLSSDGQVLWNKVYNMVSANGVRAFRTADGGLVLTSLTGTVGMLLRLDSQGNTVWQRSFAYDIDYTFQVRGINETANGDFVISTVNELFEFASDGSYIGRWRFDYMLNPNCWNYKLMARAPGSSDSLAIAGENFAGSAEWTVMMLTPGTSSLDCALMDTTGSSTAQTPMTGTSETVYAIRDSLKTWEVNIGPSVDFFESDPYCFLMPNRARPGFDHRVGVGIVNASLSTTGPITATLTFSSPITYVSCNPVPTAVNANSLVWQLPALGPNGNRLFRPRFHTPNDPGLIGTPIQYSFSFTQDSADVNLANNTSQVADHISGAYDPNIKEVEPEEFYVLGTDSILDYTIRFQNTGTAAATNIVVVDSLPLDVDVSTFRLEAYTHPCTWTITGNGILTFHFNNINLPDSNTNEPSSHGAVRFRIKPILPLFNGQQITNAADIFFDFNPAVRTPDATVTVEGSSAIVTPAEPRKLVLYPVPVNDCITAVVPAGFVVQRAFIVGIDGRPVPVRFAKEQDDRIIVNTQRFLPGAYVLILLDSKDYRLAARFTKE